MINKLRKTELKTPWYKSSKEEYVDYLIIPIPLILKMTEEWQTRLNNLIDEAENSGLYWSPQRTTIMTEVREE